MPTNEPLRPTLLKFTFVQPVPKARANLIDLGFASLRVGGSAVRIDVLGEKCPIESCHQCVSFGEFSMKDFVLGAKLVASLYAAGGT